MQCGNPYKRYTCHLPFEMPEVSAPQIPERQVNLRDFGGVGDGIVLNTDAFAKAIDALASQGGAVWSYLPVCGSRVQL